MYIDNSGPGYDNSRTTAWIEVVEDPYESESKLVLPAGLTEIGEEAFEGIAADTVIIPDGVTSIGNGAFANSQVRLVVIPSSVTSIGEGAFAGSKLELVYGWDANAALECAYEYGVTYCYLGQ